MKQVIKTIISIGLLLLALCALSLILDGKYKSLDVLCFLLFNLIVPIGLVLLLNKKTNLV